MIFKCMCVATVVAALAVAALGTVSTRSHHPPTPASDLNAQWAKFKKEFEKKYEDQDEEEMRFAIFKRNVHANKKHNDEFAKGLQTYTRGINQWTDMTVQEWTGMIHELYPLPRGAASAPPAPPPLNEPHPDSSNNLDWRTLGAVNPVRNMGTGCGSCYAFAAADAIASANAIYYETTPLVLSAQQIIDCSGQGGCSFGGLMSTSYGYVNTAGGIALESDYPYTASVGTCSTSWTAAAWVDGYTQINSSQLILYISQGPFSVGIEIDQPVLKDYDDGIITTDCGVTPQYGALVVGYNADSTPYWIVKMSWGSTWGNGGYVYIGYSVGYGTCGINLAASIPYLLDSSPNAARRPARGSRGHVTPKSDL